jgi:putative MATE family efflux protein
MTESTTLDISEEKEAVSEQPASEHPRFDRTIVEGPLGRAVWRIAWPTILTNIIAGLQGMVDHVLVGNLVGYQANAAIGVSWQIFLLVIVFVSSLFMGMSVLVARFAGAGSKDKVDRTVYQAFLTTVLMAVAIMAPLGYILSPYLLDLVNAAPNVKVEALPYLRVSFTFSIGLFLYFMTSGALRSAGDARTPMVIGIVMTVLNLLLNIVLISGLGPVPAFGTLGSAMGTSIASCLVGFYAVYKMWSGGWVVRFPRGNGWGPDWKVIRSLFKFGLPSGFQGIAMNLGGLFMLAFIGSVAHGDAAQAAYAVAYGQLFLLVTWSSNGLMGASAAVAGQNLGAGLPDRAFAAVNTAARFAVAGSAILGLVFFFLPHQLLAIFGMTDPNAVQIGTQLLKVLAFSGVFIAVALTYTGGLQGSGDTKSPLYISIISQVILPLGICFVISRIWELQPIHIWVAILVGHMTRCGLSFARFLQGKWRNIAVDIETTAA